MTWDILHEMSGRLRLRNARLRSDRSQAERIALELSAVDGIDSCRAGSLTSSLLVHYDPKVINTRRILLILGHLIDGPEVEEDSPPAVGFGLANASVGLAVLGEFAVPALLPASAALLVASNVGTIRSAWEEARARQVGLPVLATAIVGVTLVSGQFVAASLMGWMVKFWRRRHRDQQLSTRVRPIPGLMGHRGLARLVVGDAVVEVAPDRLRPGDLVSVQAGESPPADGRVVLGSALVDDRAIRGGFGPTRKGSGDPVYAGSRVIEGELRFEVEAVGASTRAAALASAIVSASAPGASRFAVSAHGEAFARQAVIPTLATAGLGLIVGDLTTAAAVLRPDYATGPGLGVSRQLQRDGATCAAEGVVVRDATAFGRLAEVDAILFDTDGVDLDLDSIRALRAFDPLAIGLLSGRPESEARQMADSIGIDHVRGGLSSEGKADLLRSFRDRGVKVAYVGDGRREPMAARAAHVAVSMADEFDPAADPASVVLLPGDPGRVAGLMALSRSHADRVRAVHGSALLPNLVCVAGAFLLGFNSLAAVIVTNLGILGVDAGIAQRLGHRRGSRGVEGIGG